MKNNINKENIIRDIIIAIGDNPNREGLKETPKRVVKMWQEVFRGYDEKTKPSITVFDNNVDDICYSQMIIDSGYFFSHCEHHMVPFFGKYYFAYIPDKKIIGLSKVARVVDFHAARLQIQERLVKDIVDDLDKVLKPEGIALVIKARHLCKEMRGALKHDGEMITSDIRGVFRENMSTRVEFMNFVK